MTAADPGSVLRALTQLGRDLAGAYRPATVVDRAARAIHESLAPSGLLIVLTDPEWNRLTVAYSHNYANAAPDDPLIDAVIRGPSRVLTPRDEQALASLGVALPASVAWWIGAPVVAVGRIVGAISVVFAGPVSHQGWSGDFLAAVAAQTAVALENTRLLELLSSGRREWEETVQVISQAFCVVDGSGAIRRANRAFGELVNVPIPSLTDQAWMGVLPPAWAEPVTRALAAGDGRTQVELRAGTRLFTLTAYRLGQGDDGAVLVFEDQTDKRRLQEQLIQSEKMSAIGQLIAGVAHDLNNPLASVVGFADYLVEESGNTPAHIRGPLRAIRQEAERAASIVRNLLNFARKHEGERRAHQVGPLIQSTLQLLRNQLNASKVDVALDVDDQLPSVVMDKNQIQQVFVNLINNAAQAIQASGIGGRIGVRASRVTGGVAVTIEDDGPGVPVEFAERIFEPFFTTKAEGEGTGLGLSICQGIVKEHGGRLSYGRRRPEGGAVFRIELPSGSEPGEPEAAAPPEPGRLRVLVVDDEPHILYYMVATLESWGHTVAVAQDGAAASRELDRRPIDVIVCDLRMPGVGGRDFYHTLQEERPALARRVIFATGDTVHGDAQQFLESAGQPYLRKPFTLAELRAALARAAAR